MHKLFFSQNFIKFSATFLLVSAYAVLAGCGAGPTGTGGTSGTGGTGGTGGTTPPVVAPSIAVALVSSSISNGTSTTVSATVKDATGAVVPNIVATFTNADNAMGTFTPSSGTALTNGSGVASITLTGGATAGASTITANAQVGTTAVSGSAGYSVGATSLAITTPAFGVNPLSAFGTTSVTVTASSGGVPVTSAQTVTFSSPCAGSGKAVLSASVVTVNGIATGSYRDNGCAGTDSVTASVSGTTSSPATLTVIAPATGSIQYVSSVPSNIGLKGTGGTEVSQVTFKVVDSGGNPLSGKTVTFGLSTTSGGIILTPNTGVAPYDVGTAVSDSNGLVVTNVNAGAVSTPVRVTASTCTTATNPCTGSLLTTQSSQLTISTGLPDQFGISLVATTHNIEGWNYDGVTSELTVRLADHFKNPVPDGTAVSFTSEGASVGPNCTTVGGGCSVTFTSQAGRPSNGRITVLTYAVGEETFTDLNGNGWADLTPVSEMIDPNGNPTDLPEAWVDYNEDGLYDATKEPYIDFNNDGLYTAADGKFNAVLCDDITPGRSAAGSCSSTHTTHVRQSQVMVLSSSYATILMSNPIVLNSCNTTTGNMPTTFPVTVVDVNGNAMPAGTKVEFTTDNGTITSATSYIQPDTTGCRSSFSSCPRSARSATFGDILVTMKSDATFTVVTPPPSTCVNSTPSGTFTVKVTSPKGLITTATTTITD